MQNDLKTLAYVLRRTNYGEADRILNIITPEGKRSVIVKGVRKAKSKLAGGVELFSLTELNIHFGKGELGLVTSARMIKYYNNIIADYERLELGAMILKKISLLSEGSDSPDYFGLVDESLDGINNGLNLGLVESWFLLNLSKVSGEEINVYRDNHGDKLDSKSRYFWNVSEKSFIKDDRGDFAVNEIKMLRLILTAKLVVVARVKNYEEMLPQLLKLARLFYT